MTYQCDKCGKLFEESLGLPYQEYPGGSMHVEYVSPCCHAGFIEV